MDERVARVRSVMLEGDLDAVLAASPANVTYLTGHAPTVEVGVSPFSGPSLALLGKAGEPDLVLPEVDPGQSAPRAGVTPHTYPSYDFKGPLRPGEGLVEAALGLLHARGPRAGRLGVEGRHLPWSVAAAITAEFPALALVDVEERLRRARMVKTPEEIAAIRRAVQLTDIGQRHALEVAVPGMTEAELWASVRGAMEAAAGRRLAVWADCCSGPATAEGGSFPTGRPMLAGDILMTDLSPCLEGYWGDSCNCVVVGGGPTARQEEMFEIAHSTLLAVTEAVKPGVEARELDALCRRLLAEKGGWQLPHHTGHGLGATFHDDPRLTPYDQTPLQAGMVLAIEPGVYDAEAGIGIRTEHIVAVTSDGCQVLTGFRHRLAGAQL